MECEKDRVSSECYNISENTYGPLDLIQHTASNINFLLLWNEFSILVKNTSCLMTTESFHYMDFSVKQIYLQENIFLCLGKDHVLYFTILKKKNENKILETLEFKQILKNVSIVFNNKSDIYVLLKKENFLCLYKYIFIGSSKIKVANIYKLNLETVTKDVLLRNISMQIRRLNFFAIDFIQNIFQIEMSKINMDMLLLFVIKDNVLYWSLLEEDSNAISNLNILYSSPTNIKSFYISNDDQIKIYLNLDTGSIVILSYDVVDKCLSMDIVHLNSPLDKIVYINNNSTLIYSDTDKLYQSLLELKMDEYNVTLKNALPISSPYDFIYDSNASCIYCTTFHNILYKVFLKDVKQITSPTSVSVPRNFSSVKDTMLEVQEEMKRNNTFLNLTDKENDYISILFLNSKQDLVRNCMATCFKVCTYNQSIDCNDVPTMFTRNISNETINVIELNIHESLQHKLEKMMNSVKDLFFINVHLTSKNISYDSQNTSILTNKTLCIKLGIPYTSEVNLPFTVNASIISLMPGVFQEIHKFWSVISTNKALVNSTNFLTCETVNEKQRPFSNTNQNSYKDKMLTVAEKNSKFIFDIHETLKSENKPYSLYIKLSDSFEKLCNKFSEHFTAQLAACNAENIKMKLVDINFVHGHKTLTLRVLNEAVQLNIQKLENNEQRLKITSTHNSTCFEVYRFILTILKTIQINDPRKQYLPHFDYVILKNLKDNMEKIMNTTHMTSKDTLSEFLESFNQDALGVLPI